MPSIYYKISPDNGRWLDQLADSAGITKAHAIDLIITVARTENWFFVRGQEPRIERPGRPSPAAGPCTASQEDTSV